MDLEELAMLLDSIEASTVSEIEFKNAAEKVKECKFEVGSSHRISKSHILLNQTLNLNVPG